MDENKTVLFPRSDILLLLSNVPVPVRNELPWDVDSLEGSGATQGSPECCTRNKRTDT